MFYVRVKCHLFVDMFAVTKRCPLKCLAEYEEDLTINANSNAHALLN